MITFSGHSDDIVHVDFDDGQEGKEYYPQMAGPFDDEQDYFVVGGVMKVTPVYDGCWSFAPGLLEEDADFPDWPISVTLDRDTTNGYTVCLNIEAPPKTRVVKARN